MLPRKHRSPILLLALTLALLPLLLFLWSARPPATQAQVPAGQPLHLTPAHQNQHPWPMAGREQLRSGYSGLSGPRYNPLVPEPWPFTAGALLEATPVVGSDGSAYVGGDDARFHALKGSAGTDELLRRWTVTATDAIRSAAALKEEVAHAGRAGEVRVFFTTVEGDVYGVDADSGEVAWTETLGSPVAAGSAPAVETNPDTGLARLYLATGEGVYALQEEAGGSGALPGVREEWFNFYVPSLNAVALSPTGAYLYATEGQNLYVLDAASGALTCDFDLGTALSAPAVHPDGRLFLGTGSGEVWAGQVQTSPSCNFAHDGVAVGAPVTERPALGPAGAVVAVTGAHLVGLDWPNGTVAWRQEDLFPQPYPPLVDGNGTTFVSLADGRVRAFGSDGVPQWSKEVVVTADLTSPALDNNGRLYLSGNGQVHVLVEDPAYQVAFEASIPGGDRDLYLLAREYEANGPRRALTAHGQDEKQPAFSQTGRQLAFVSGRAGTDDIFLANSAARDAINVTGVASYSGTDEADPAFSPVGRAGRSLLPSGENVLAATQILSDGQELFFVNLPHLEQTGNLAVLDLSHWLTQEVGSDASLRLHNAQVAFSPDGRHIAYTACEYDGETGTRTEELVLLELQPGAPVRTVVRDDSKLDAPDCSMLAGFHPAFSPDGRLLLYQSPEPAGGTLTLYAVAQKQFQEILLSPFETDIDGRHPAWSPDGKQVVYVGRDRDTGEEALFMKWPGSSDGWPGDLLQQEPNLDHPAFHPQRYPEPNLGYGACDAERRGMLDPDEEQPLLPVEIRGCGLDQLDVQENDVTFFTVEGAQLPADLAGGKVDVQVTASGILSPRVPAMAGDGRLAVATPYGRVETEPFQVVPLPLSLEPARERLLEQVTVVGYGMMQSADPALSSPLQNEVTFTSLTGLADAPAEVTGAGIDVCGGSGIPCPAGTSGAVQWLQVTVPREATTGTVEVASSTAFGEGEYDRFELVRTPVDMAVSLAEEPICNLGVGGSGEYVYEVVNEGSGFAARDASFAFSLPAGRARATVTAESGTCSSSGNSVDCALGTLDAGASVRVSVTVTATRSTRTRAHAEVSNLFLETDPSDNDLRHEVSFYNLTDTVDVAVSDVEVTQGLQDLNQSIQLIQGREAMVRVYLDTGGVPVAEVPVVLRETDGMGNTVGYLGQESPGGGDCYRQPAGERQRDLSKHSVNFRLTDMSKDRHFEVVVDGDEILPDPDRSNNRQTFSTDVYASGNICLFTYPVRNLGYDGNPNNDIKNYLGQTIPIAQPNQNYVLQRQQFLTRALSLLPARNIYIYPRSRVLKPNRNLLIRRYHLSASPGQRSTILNRLARWGQSTGTPQDCAAAVGNPGSIHFMGVAHPGIEANTDGETFNGVAHVPGQELIVRFPIIGNHVTYPYGGRTLAHELGHNFGRWHVKCPKSGDNVPDDLDSNYPYDTCDLGPADETSYFATDVTRRMYASNTVLSPTQVLNGNQVGDLMSYADVRWTSDYTWNAIYDRLPSSGQPAAPAQAAAQAAAQEAETATEVYAITGVISETESLNEHVVFDPAYHLNTAIMPEEKMAAALASQPEEGPYRVILRGDAEEVLSTTAFTPTAPSDPLEPLDHVRFDLLLPYAPGGVRIQVLHEGEEIGSLPISAEAPQVAVTQPDGGVAEERLEIAWESADPDSETLYHMVQYSWDDGQTWEVLALDLLSRTMTISTTYLAGNADPTALVRVVASDGANTTSAVTEVPFQIPPHRPQIFLTQPADGATLARRDVLFQATAYDAEDGPLDETLLWYVEGDGFSREGSGRRLRIADMAPGTYTATVVAVEADGRETARSHTFTIAACVAPQAPLPRTTREGEGVLLTWDVDDSQRSFVVHRSPDPFFNPTAETTIGTTSGDNFFDGSALGGDAYYLVEALGCDGARAVTAGGRGGRFSFPLEPGS